MALHLGAENTLFLLTALTVLLSLILGGGTRSGFLSDAILQFSAIPLLLFALWSLGERSFWREAVWPLRLCLAAVLLPLLQLIPLPPQVWTVLPKRDEVIATFQLLGEPLPWMPITVTPRATWLAALSMLPAVAIFLGTILLPYRRRRSLSLIMLIVGVVSVFLGLMQVAQGPESPLRFFTVTSPLEAVGFFANRNHFAALLYSMSLIAAVFAVSAIARIGGADHRQKLETAHIASLAAALAMLAALVAAQIIARSRAGLILAIVALFAAMAFAVVNGRRTGRSAAKWIAAAIALAAVFTVQYGLYRLEERFAADSIDKARVTFARNTLKAAHAFMPLGAGMGSFVTVYGLFEEPQDTIAGIYANRAHNDILELVLETGLPGIVLLIVSGAWLLQRSYAVWLRPPRLEMPVDLMLQRAGTIIIALLIAHSFVDYPLRTAAIMAVMSFACALLVPPPGSHEKSSDLNAKRSAERPAHPSRQSRSPQSPSIFRAGETGSLQEFEWPSEWRKP